MIKIKAIVWTILPGMSRRFINEKKFVQEVLSFSYLLYKDGQDFLDTQCIKYPSTK